MEGLREVHGLSSKKAISEVCSAVAPRAETVFKVHGRSKNTKGKNQVLDDPGSKVLNLAPRTSFCPGRAVFRSLAKEVSTE